MSAKPGAHLVENAPYWAANVAQPCAYPLPLYEGRCSESETSEPAVEDIRDRLFQEDLADMVAYVDSWLESHATEAVSVEHSRSKTSIVVRLEGFELTPERKAYLDTRLAAMQARLGDPACIRNEVFLSEHERESHYIDGDGSLKRRLQSIELLAYRPRPDCKPPKKSPTKRSNRFHCRNTGCEKTYLQKKSLVYHSTKCPFR